MAKRNNEKGRIDVIVRKRPLNDIEIARGDRDVVMCKDNSAIIEELKLRIDGTSYIEQYEFRVDRFYDENADNQLIYEEYVRPLVEFAFREKKTCSCFTYGQTGSGKTYTMIGSRTSKSSTKQCIPGIYEYAAHDIYRMLNEPEYKGKLEIMISFYEIYCGKLYDLLQNRKLLEALDNGRREVVIKDLTVRKITCKEDLIAHMLDGLNLRRIGQNSQNDQSSRSHALLRIELREVDSSRVAGRIGFIDLAGSERGADCISQPKQTQMDGAGINRSLLALKECIRAMDLEKTHIPFRDSELTKVLRDVFMGGSKNVMIANICPSGASCEQTLNTLRYASRVKNFRQTSIFSDSGGNGDVLSAPRPSSSRHLQSEGRFKTSAVTTSKFATNVSPPLRANSSISPRISRNFGRSSSSMKIGKTRALPSINSGRIGLIKKQNEHSKDHTMLSSIQNYIESNNSALGNTRTNTEVGGISRCLSRLPNPLDHFESCSKSQDAISTATTTARMENLESMLDFIKLDQSCLSLMDSIMGDVENNNPLDMNTLFNTYCHKDLQYFRREDLKHLEHIQSNAITQLRRAEEVNNHVANLLVLQDRSDPDTEFYRKSVKNKLLAQLKPLLFLKQSLEELDNVTRLFEFAKTLIETD